MLPVAKDPDIGLIVFHQLPSEEAEHRVSVGWAACSVGTLLHVGN